MPLDPKNSLTHTVMFAPLSRATNNTASAGIDLKGYEGPVDVQVNVGVQTAGDNAMTFTHLMQSAANNTASEATNISGASAVTGGNSAASYSAQVQVDPRACFRYLFGRLVITAGNSPAAPTSAVVIGQKKKQ